MGIIGSSGTGKSTTLRLAAGLLQPDKVGGRCRGWLVRSGEAAALPGRHAGCDRCTMSPSHHTPFPAGAAPPPCPPAQGEVLIKGEPRHGLISDDDTSDKLKVGLVFQVRCQVVLRLCVRCYRGGVRAAARACWRAEARRASWTWLEAAWRRSCLTCPTVHPPQSGALFDSLTVGENVGFLLHEHTRLPLPKIQVRGLQGGARRRHGTCCR